MPYCSKCGVKVEDNIENCPLCKLPIQKFDKIDSFKKKKYPTPNFKVSISNRKKRFIAWQIISVFFLISFLLVMAINLLKTGSLSWAGYPMTAIGGAWLLITFILLLFKSPFLIILGNFLVTTGLLALLDVMDGKLNWFLVLGLPIVGMVTLMLAFTFLFIKYTKNYGALFISFFITQIIAFCIGINLLASGYQNDLKISWSLFVAISLAPIAFLSLWYHFYLKTKIDLKKYFHY